MNLTVCRLIAAANKQNITAASAHESLTLLMHHTIVIHPTRITATAHQDNPTTVTYFWEDNSNTSLALSTGKLTSFQKKLGKATYTEALSIILKELESATK